MVSPTRRCTWWRLASPIAPDCFIEPQTPQKSFLARTLAGIFPGRFLFCLLLFLAAAYPAEAAEVAILKSADLAAYNQAVAGFKAAMPPATTFLEYDMQGD